MRAVVWGINQYQARAKLEQIKCEYLKYHIKIVKELCTKTEASVEFENGDQWCALNISEYNCRGRRYNLVYVPSILLGDDYKDMYACIRTHLMGPWTGIHRYDDDFPRENYEDTYEAHKALKEELMEKLNELSSN